MYTLFLSTKLFSMFFLKKLFLIENQTIIASIFYVHFIIWYDLLIHDTIFTAFFYSIRKI